MDDILIASDNKKELLETVCLIDDYAKCQLHLRLKPPVCCQSNVGLVFLGYRILPYQKLLSGRSKRRFRSKLLKYDKLLGSGRWSEQEYAEHVQPLLSFVKHADSKSFCRSCIEISNKVTAKEWV